jgi:hypothetical protein
MTDKSRTEDAILFDRDMANLRGLLKVAMMVELTTIPAYLQATFSIDDAGDADVNAEAREAIRSVLVEEMLHLTLAANILNAVGGAAALDDPKWVPRYPCPLFPKIALGYHVHDPETGERRTIIGAHKLTIHLRRFTPEQVGVFEDIEAQHTAKPGTFTVEIDSIGRFYALVASELAHMVGTWGAERVFCGDVSRQVGPEYYYAAGGGLSIIDPAQGCPLAQAQAIVDRITEEGEGLEHGNDIFDGEPIPGTPLMDVAHVFKFREILAGRRYQAMDRWDGPPTGEAMPVDWSAVHPAIDDPDPDDPALSPDVAEAMRAFDRRYSDLLRLVNRAYSGEPHLLVEGVHAMFDLKYAGIALMRTPLGPGRTAAPAWRLVGNGS